MTRKISLNFCRITRNSMQHLHRWIDRRNSSSSKLILEEEGNRKRNEGIWKEEKEVWEKGNSVERNFGETSRNLEGGRRNIGERRRNSPRLASKFFNNFSKDEKEFAKKRKLQWNRREIAYFSVILFIEFY